MFRVGLSQKNETITNLINKKSRTKKPLISIDGSADGKNCKSIGLFSFFSGNMQESLLRKL